MDTSPNSQLDVLAQDVSKMKQDVAAVVKRCNELDVTILKILKTFKIGEESFELRVARVLHNVMSGMVHQLEHSIETTAEGIAQLERGFDIYPVDGTTVKENEKTVLVTRLVEGGYNYSLASDPETIINEGTEAFSAFFDANQAMFNDKQELLVNIIAYTTKKSEQEPA
jgi:hypothetical protein